MDRKHGTAAMELSVNEYELERDKRIARNLDALKRLGLTSTASDGLTAKMSTFQLLQPAKLAQRPPKLLQHQPEVGCCTTVYGYLPPVPQRTGFRNDRVQR